MLPIHALPPAKPPPPPVILEKLLDLEKNPGARAYTDEGYDLERYRVWLEAIGSPHLGQHFVHIAGTKGKGSTAAVTEALLRAFRFPTAMYSSPHLEHYGERYRYDSRPWTGAEFEEHLQRFFDDLTPELRADIEGPHSYRTVFETLTALALKEFRRRGRELDAEGPGLPQVVVWETGLGGRLDSTNVVTPMLSVITTLGMDHTKILGDTIEKIAAEKAGIIKPGRPVIVGRQAPEFEARVMPVIRDRAAEVGAPLVRAWEHNPIVESRGTDTGQAVRLRLPDGNEIEAEIPLRGEFQRGNVEAAVAAAWYVAREFKVSPSPRDWARGLSQVSWPGRMEIHRNRPSQPLIIDGAHCPLSARALAREVRAQLEYNAYNSFVLLWGMQRDKDHRAFLQSFIANLGRVMMQGVIAYPVTGPRAAEPARLAAAALELGCPAIEAASVEEAVRLAEDSAVPVVAAGTLYTIARIRALWTAGHA